MNFYDYQTKAARTIASDFSYDQEMHALYGMVAEMGEIIEAYCNRSEDVTHVEKECGDLYWMIAEYCTSQGWSMAEINGMEHAVDCSNVLPFDLVVQVGKLEGLYQKMFQGHLMLERDYRQSLANVLHVLNAFVQRYCTVSECLEMNIQKLLVRYPNGFETKRSMRRSEDDI